MENCEIFHNLQFCLLLCKGVHEIKAQLSLKAEELIIIHKMYFHKVSLEQNDDLCEIFLVHNNDFYAFISIDVKSEFLCTEIFWQLLCTDNVSVGLKLILLFSKCLNFNFCFKYISSINKAFVRTRKLRQLAN